MDSAQTRLLRAKMTDNTSPAWMRTAADAISNADPVDAIAHCEALLAYANARYADMVQERVDAGLDISRKAAIGRLRLHRVES